jgi:hypothetical protein
MPTCTDWKEATEVGGELVNIANYAADFSAYIRHYLK